MSLIKLLTKELNCQDLYLDNITLKKQDNSVYVNFLIKSEYSKEIKSRIKQKVSAVLPQPFKLGQVNFAKLFCDEQTAADFCKQLLKADFPNLYGALTNTQCKLKDFVYNITLTFDNSAQSYAQSCGAAQRLTNLLEDKYKEKFSVAFTYIESETAETESTVTYTPPVNSRIINVTDIAPLCGKKVEGPAIYIEDCAENESAVLCGKITEIREITTSKGKIMFIFMLKDYTAEIFCKTFPSAANYPKIKKLETGSEIILYGTVTQDPYSYDLVCLTRQISYCILPQNFVPQKREEPLPPAEYKTVKPEIINETFQVNIFEKNISIPKFLTGKTFVVFDVETTGLNCGMDRLTELGAVKITDGVITHSFGTLINPKIHIRQETVKLNGIDDELVKDSPTVEDVMPDFYKFTYGASLVAHNLDFDKKFIRFDGKKFGYYFENQSYDTMLLARNYLKKGGLPNYKLETLCKYFDIELKDHHRAVFDAMATAKLFIKLAKYL